MQSAIRAHDDVLREAWRADAAEAAHLKLIRRIAGSRAFLLRGGVGGICVLDPKGNKLGRIVHGDPATTNIAFGGDDQKTERRRHLRAAGGRPDA